MRKFCCIVALIMFGLTLRAQKPNYFMFKTGKGDMRTVSIGANGLEIRFSKQGIRSYDCFEPTAMGFSFGFNMLPSPDYSLYTAQDGEFMDLSVGKSNRIGITPIQVSAGINRNGTFGIVSGLGMVWNNYVFENNITIRNINGIIMPEPLDRDYKKSKLTTFSLSIPVELEYQFPARNNPNNRFFIAGGVLGEAMFKSHTKYKKPKHKSESGQNLETFQGALSFRGGYGNLSIFSYYYLTDLFKNNKGPEVQVFTVGVGLKFGKPIIHIEN